MTFEEMIRISIKQYFEKSSDHEKMETSKNRKYTKSYFDSVRKDFLTKEDNTKELEKQLGEKIKK